MTKSLPQYHGAMDQGSDVPSGAGFGVSADLATRVEHVINLIRPTVQSDGGDVEFIEVTPAKVVRIRLHGACVGCPSSSVTLQIGIERNLKAHIPEIAGVEAVA